ncbi:MAG: hypothetical protein ACO3Z6_06900 [Pseudomonadales bacterium]
MSNKTQGPRKGVLVAGLLAVAAAVGFVALQDTAPADDASGTILPAQRFLDNQVSADGTANGSRGGLQEGTESPDLETVGDQGIGDQGIGDQGIGDQGIGDQGIGGIGD